MRLNFRWFQTKFMNSIIHILLRFPDVDYDRWIIAVGVVYYVNNLGRQPFCSEDIVLVAQSLRNPDITQTSLYNKFRMFLDRSDARVELSWINIVESAFLDWSKMCVN